MDAERLRPTALRLALMVLVIADLIRLLVESSFMAVPAYLGPPVSWVGHVAESLWILGIAAIIAAVGIVRWGRIGSSLGGGVALIVLAAMSIVHTYTRGEHDESFFFTGMLLGGWLITEASARALGKGMTPAEAARWGSVGAMAFLAGAYMTAGVAKLGSVSWGDGENVRLALTMSPDVYPNSISLGARSWIAGQGWVPRLVAVFVAVIQVGAVGMVGPPAMRALSGTLLWAMHLGIVVFLGITFPEPLYALPMMTWPWYARLGAVERHVQLRSPGTPWPALAVTAVAVVISVSLWLNKGPAAPVFDKLYAPAVTTSQVHGRHPSSAHLAHWSKIVSSPSAKSRWTTGP